MRKFQIIGPSGQQVADGGEPGQRRAAERAAGQVAGRRLLGLLDLLRVDRQGAVGEEGLHLREALARAADQGVQLRRDSDAHDREQAHQQADAEQQGDEGGDRRGHPPAPQRSGQRGERRREDQRDDDRQHDELERDPGVDHARREHDDDDDLQAAQRDAAERVRPDRREPARLRPVVQRARPVRLRLRVVGSGGCALRVGGVDPLPPVVAGSGHGGGAHARHHPGRILNRRCPEVASSLSG
jgi:hypothetical protein